MRVRPPAVAGAFYPGDPARLCAMLETLLAGNPARGPAPKALIVPHAGYIYSGAVAAHAYNLLKARGTITRVVLLGPAHFVPVAGLAAPTVEAFVTPLGRVALDREALDALSDLPQVIASDVPHAEEHSLEVQLPFLQTVLGNFKLAPLAVGEAPAEQVAEVLERLWGGDETLIVISSDLSHYHPYDEARRIDEATSRLILEMKPSLHGMQACGCRAINGLLAAAKRRAMNIHLLDLRNSGDTAGPKDRVVGYGAYALH